MTKEELKEIENLKAKVLELRSEIDEHNVVTKYLRKKRKNLMKEIDELEAKYVKAED